jgi:fatty acid desaturase
MTQSAPTATARDREDDTILGFPRASVEALAEELSALRKEIRGQRDATELDHLRKLERWGRWCTFLGHGSGWLAPNPLSALLIGLGKTTRWAVIAHPISHGGYDSVPGIPERYTRRGFGKGWRRFVDWFDWITPDAWHHEHDLMHHVRLGEDRDPDVVEDNFAHVRDGDWPLPLRYLYAAVSGLTWKFAYYAPTTLMELQAARAHAAGEPTIPRTVLAADLWNPLHPRGRELWMSCYLPYATFHFVALPLAFLPLGPWAMFSSWANACMGEAVANLHSYLIIVPNHAGDDLTCFDGPGEGKAEFYLRQILGSVNYRTGGDLNDWLHGWLNYQIEHHLFPNMSQREYQKLQPRVKALCDEYGVPYHQESVWRRALKTLDIMVGRTSMKRWPATV